MADKLFFAKTNENAIVPSKRKEDAGYDFYACFEDDEIRLVKGKANLVPTGIASAFPSDYYLNLKHERGSTGKYGMSILAGVVDSGYRGQVWVNISPTYKDVIISKTFMFPKKDNGTPKPFETEDVIYYPYELGIAQGTLEVVPDVKVEEICYNELKDITSERGESQLGDSGK